MKKVTPFLIAFCAVIFACNDSAESDPVDTADSANESKIDAQDSATGTGSTSSAAPVDEETADFFVKAADGGMAEVAAGKMAQEKATNPKVKEFAAMMITDHTGANAGLKELAGKKNVTLPDTVSTDHQKQAADLAKKTGKNFDKAYMDMQVKDHEKTVDLFEKHSKNANDPEVKTFIDNTLPKLKTHLDAARTLNKSL
jgi:putative membrane protein